MTRDDEAGVLEFLRSAESLKTHKRTAWTSAGERESVAEHTWRVALMALVLGDELGGLDVGRLLRICIIHDLGEAIGGDVPAIEPASSGKAQSERRDLLTLLSPLPPRMRDEITALWDEYEAAVTPEARAAKALDKLETIMQHNQGTNPGDFDYAFNLDYGRRFTEQPALIAGLRRVLDDETRARDAAARSGSAP
ncbi:MAG TPA: HD domain-containing protein [Longimicrobiales bacterium]